jgi:hypothetical protein
MLQTLTTAKDVFHARNGAGKYRHFGTGVPRISMLLASPVSKSLKGE